MKQQQSTPFPPRERLKEALEALGNPHQKIGPVIHVTGTNGKGSTVAFMESCLKAGGYKVNSFTSPHVFEWRERIKINGLSVSQDSFDTTLECAKKVSKSLTL
ncbi:MAG: hypothetical protein GY915_03230, partial [bacterium]|nr:hypothetical protein [bacterium]